MTCKCPELLDARLAQLALELRENHRPPMTRDGFCSMPTSSELAVRWVADAIDAILVRRLDPAPQNPAPAPAAQRLNEGDAVGARQVMERYMAAEASHRAYRDRVEPVIEAAKAVRIQDHEKIRANKLIPVYSKHSIKLDKHVELIDLLETFDKGATDHAR